jgi:RNA polymerase sigma factor (TIGR02999 family)
MAGNAGDVTELLDELVRGDKTALDRLLPLVYAELRALAASHFRGERGDHTLQPTALVHEAYLRLASARFSGFDARAQFFAMAATVMRRILVDHGRERAAAKRGGHRTTLKDTVAISPKEIVDSAAIGETLDRLEKVDADLCRVAELRFFGGFSVEETAELMGISAPTVKRRWSVARAWIAHELRPPDPGEHASALGV